MKISKYNYIVYDESYSYWLNGITRNFFRLSRGLGKKMESLMSDVCLLRQTSSMFYDKLCQSGFLIEDGVNELDLIKQKAQEAISSKDYFLIIIPTLNCNFHCWYCIQDHIPSVMSSQTLQNVKKHIDYMVEKKGITSLHIGWFGGEPFMYLKQVIIPISSYAIDKCKQAGIPFINSATTNGYFLGEKNLDILKKLHFTQFQITLDGDKRFHDKVKYQGGCASTFDHVLQNINRILKNESNVVIYLRINYTHTTLSEEIVKQVNSFIQEDCRKNIVVILKKVWQENVDKRFEKTLISIEKLFLKSGYNVSQFSLSSFIPCYASKESYNSINFNGNVVKCTACNDLYDDIPKGILNDDGTISWSDNFDAKYQTLTYENSRCLHCKYLPICMGPCPRDYIAGMSECKYKSEDVEIEHSLLGYLKQQY